MEGTMCFQSSVFSSPPIIILLDSVALRLVSVTLISMATVAQINFNYTFPAAELPSVQQMVWCMVYVIQVILRNHENSGWRWYRVTILKSSKLWNTRKKRLCDWNWFRFEISLALRGEDMNPCCWFTCNAHVGAELRMLLLCAFSEWFLVG